jgi:pyrroloquinoline quinone biosynthesis protein B
MMHVRVLGAAAGGAFPQWNCACPTCRAAREGRAAPRTQSSLAVSADGARWLLVDVSPDVRHQIEAFPPLLPAAGRARGSGIAAIALSDAQLDHAVGLLLMREGGTLVLHTTARIREGLTSWLPIVPTLEAYCRVVWRETPLGAPVEPADADGRPLGLRYTAIPVDSALPPYMRQKGVEPSAGDNVAHRIEDPATGRRIVYAPGLGRVTDALRAELAAADAFFVDGTCFRDDEMPGLGLSAKRARDMGHLAVGDPGGLLERLGDLPTPRKIFIHVNNTNPMLVESSPERRRVEAAGFEVASDGLTLVLD